MVPPKRFKRSLTVFESLPNELFLQIFSYLSDADAVCIFSRLNGRFRSLTLNYCDKFDFKSVSKGKFDNVIRQHDIHRWRALRLSDDEKTPGQVTYFYESFLTTENITQLHNLSIIHTHSSTALLYLRQLTSFQCLRSLSIGFVCGETIPLLELDSLKHLVITSCPHTNWMKKLSLESLQHTIEHNCTHGNNLKWPTSLRHLKVFITRSADTEIVRTSLGHAPQLTRLAIYASARENSPPNGRIWEDLITSSLPLLKTFEFSFQFWRDSSSSSNVDQIVSTFATPFYLEEKSWFVQCDALHQPFSMAILYSLPFAFQRFEIMTNSFHKSISTLKATSTDNPKKNLYKNISALVVNTTCEKMNEDLICDKIIDLTLKYTGIPIEWVYLMTRIRQLTLGQQIDMSPKAFRRLLKGAPYLQSLIASKRTLKLLSDQWNDKSVCRLLSRKIQFLKIAPGDCIFVHTNDYIRVNELLPIVRVFSERCQYLNISVYSRNIVAGLILRSMQHLRSLKVRLQEHNDQLKITKEWLIEQNEMFKNIDYVLVENGNEYTFWLSRQP